VARRKTPRLAYCEYVSPNPENSIQVKRARQWLFEAVKRVHPRFLRRLSSQVFPFYSQLAESGYKVARMAYSSKPYAVLTEDRGLKAALRKWAAEFNAESGWLLDDALRTLQGWYVTPEWRKSLKWNTVYTHSPSASTGKPFHFQSEGWETQLLTWATYRESVSERFEVKLLEYERETRKLAESCGLVRAQQKHSPDNFDWFVLYQFAGRSATEIAKEKYKGKYVEDADSAVLKGIKAAARLIGWDHLREPEIKRKRKIG